LKGGAENTSSAPLLFASAFDLEIIFDPGFPAAEAFGTILFGRGVPGTIFQDFFCGSDEFFKSVLFFFGKAHFLKNLEEPPTLALRTFGFQYPFPLKINIIDQGEHALGCIRDLPEF